MLPSPNRLRHEKDIKALFADGKGVFDSACGLKFRKNGLEATRFAVVVGTKVSKSAVVRNRVRRQIRSVIEARLLQIKPGFDVAVLVRGEALKLKFPQIEERIVGALKKGRLL